MRQLRPDPKCEELTAGVEHLPLLMPHGALPRRLRMERSTTPLTD